MTTKLLLVAFVLIVSACSQPEKRALLVPDVNNGGITLPEKFGAVVVVDTLGRGRHMAINANGDIYLHLSRKTKEGNGIIALRDTTNDGRL